ncbi:E3 ISG15--protein ligase HERC5-like isoform X2 [Physella acuta]|nr:E3 ISG15--protein ligase HERC5-like isoform X2 [Physella acuta]XP_059163499.1 E3 ISG15--protein ligase HERC5-like isoform X2 [Physella acuta]XP_059163500.1 E3 ISG15--protein ligase HERC5-like isoform X2 [Physella acuta]XP_059163501.1 E3 ISG15--protein ligase HERC5-like isoform X2 [Physella acuta]XP_059163502.1 E3 ISG15--protein ligase HERC5-like isoform X2 [Physella acuta]XP_059163503.1 E3 ISG15--protein ligase HERC5-like isoform X2 [Physella acuta]XP_059163504.1 E3 ISG15--protein ligase H
MKMLVYGCGFNGFSQIAAFCFDDLKYKYERRGFNKHYKQTLPINLFELKENDNLISLVNTWSQTAMTIKNNDTSTSYLNGFKCNDNNEDDSICTYTNQLVIASTDKDILLKSYSNQLPFGIVANDNSSPQAVNIIGAESLTLIAGDHLDFHAVYDGSKFGKLTISYTGDDNGQNGIYFIQKIINTRILIKEVSCGKEHVLLLTNCGTLFSYGIGSRGQLGQSSVDTKKVPTLLDALNGIEIRKISAGGWHSTAISDVGDLYVWGWNDCGQLGLAAYKENVLTNVQTEPQYVHFSDECCMKSVACGSRHTVILLDDGKVFASGWNCYGQLGLGHTEDQKTFVPVTTLLYHCDQVFAGQWNTFFVCQN